MSKKIILSLACLLCAVPWLSFFITWHFEQLAQPDKNSIIVFTKPPLDACLNAIGLGSLVVLLLVLIWALIRKQKAIWPAMLAIFTISILSYPLIGTIAFRTLSWGGWTVEDSTRAADGQTYCFLHEGSVFGPGYSHAIARRESGNIFWFKAKILGLMGEDDITGTLARPEPVKKITDNSNMRIYSSPTGWLAGIREDECTIAYNTKTKRTYTSGELAQISPFVLISPKDRLHEPDLKKIRLSASMMDQEVHNPNPEVRLFVRKALASKR